MSDYFIITAGPTGSGKTKLVDETLKVLGIQHEPVKKYLIDDYVESDPRYKSRVKEIINEVETECSKKGGATLQECVKNAYEHPSPELFEKFKTAYFETRKQGCSERCKKRKEVDKIDCEGCNIALNLNLKNLSKNNSPSKVAVFETTGMSIPMWILKDTTYVPAHSKIVIAYSLVGLRELVKRNKHRAYQSILEFKQNRSKPAPRLPDVSEQVFRGVVGRIREVLLDLYRLYQSCILQQNKNCGIRPIHQLILFDNNGPSHTLIYNSMEESQRVLSESQFREIIDKSLDDKMNGGCGCGGGGGRKKKRTSRTRRMGRGRTRPGKTRTSV
jgi:hypothetical protein